VQSLNLARAGARAYMFKTTVVIELNGVKFRLVKVSRSDGISITSEDCKQQREYTSGMAKYLCVLFLGVRMVPFVCA
jgi:hypothetical protein